MDSHLLDSIDRKMLAKIQDDGKISNLRLAESVNLSPARCFERLRRLCELGYVTGFTTHLDPEKLNLSVLVFARIVLKCTSLVFHEQFIEMVRSLPEIQECHMILGGGDYFMKIRTRNMKGYWNVLDTIAPKLGDGYEIYASTVVEEVKTGSQLSINKVFH